MGPLSPSESTARLHAMLQALLLAMIAASTAALPLARMSVDLVSFAPMLACVALLAGLARVAARSASARLASAFELATLLLAAMLPILLISLATMRGAAPLTDALLARADAALGLDAIALVEWTDRQALLARLLGIAYSSFALQVGLLPILLVLSGKPGRGYRFAIAFLLLTIIASAISAAFPALGTLEHAGIAPGTRANIEESFGYGYLESLRAVRSESHFALSAERAAGILTFPSVHAGVAVLCGWAGWGLRGRWGLVALNAAMFVSAATHGSHYFVDLIAGGLLAAAILLCLSADAIDAKRFARRLQRFQPVGRAARG